MSDTTYNGWTNYETWNVKLWLDNERSSYDYWTEMAQECWDLAKSEGCLPREEVARYDLTAKLKDAIEEANPLVEEASMFSDLLGAAISEVNWGEIAQAYLEGVNKDN